MLPLILQLVIITYKITPLPASCCGTLQDFVEQHSDNAKHWQDHDQQGYQSYSRSQQGCPGAGAEGEPASRDACTAEGQPEAPEEPASFEGLDHNPLPHREWDKDHSHQRTHRCNQQAHRDRSGSSHKHGAHQPALEEDQQLAGAAHCFE